MKRVFVILLFCITASLSISCQAQDTTTVNEGKYKLYPTENMWTFLKLNTQTGQVYQVQYTVNSGSSGEWIVSERTLNTDGVVQNGRFELYATQNMYNFLLLDKNTGAVYQIQWSIEEEYRGYYGRISEYDE